MSATMIGHDPGAFAAIDWRARFTTAIVLMATVTLTLAPDLAHATPQPCHAPAELAKFGAPTPRLVRSFEADTTIRIVALGSSSTEGAGASSSTRSYPAQLEQALRQRVPSHHFEVINRGKGGQLAADMLARIDTDVIAAWPALVIWQTGVNDAIRNIDVAQFRATLEAGIARFKAHAIDVVLLDLQYYPTAAKVPAYRAYLDVIRDTGARLEVPVFRRFALMTHLIESRQFKAEELLAPDLFHQNDLSYSCLAAAMADAVGARLTTRRGAPGAKTLNSAVGTGAVSGGAPATLGTPGAATTAAAMP